MSVIARMVDAACGLAGPLPRATLRCPTCQKSKWTGLEKTDPEGTATVVVKCPACAEASGFVFPVYLDNDGSEIKVDP